MTVTVLHPAPAEDPTPRPGSRAARQSAPLAVGVLKEIAAEYGVCVRPIAIRRIDDQTGQADIIEVPCGATLASKCTPCAERNRRLRLQQLREGWHLADEPTIHPRQATNDERGLVELRAHFEYERVAAEMRAEWDQVTDLDAGIDEVTEALRETELRGNLTPADDTTKPKRQRSTRRRQDTTDLPRQQVDNRTVGRVYTGRDGRTHRPSMLISPTLGSYGTVHSSRRKGRPICDCGHMHADADPAVGTPIDPAGYDYRRAALDAIHFARLLDRFWQNLRRTAGFNVQYGGCVELQRRLAPHGHFAVRGTFPRRLIKAVAAATYHQVWWPAHDQMLFTPDRPPRWNPDAGPAHIAHRKNGPACPCGDKHPTGDPVVGTPSGGYVDPTTGDTLPTWDEALDALDAQGETAEPAHVARFGMVDARGVASGTKDAERSIRYVTKYVTKDITETVSPTSDVQRAHFDRLHDQLRHLPCAPTCTNWLLYGVQPKNARKGATPGNCRGKVHQRTTLGFTGRRVLISRQWSNKSLTDHRADNRAWVKSLLELSADRDQTDNDREDQTAEPDTPTRYRYELARPDDPDVPPIRLRIMRAVSTRMQWRRAINQAKQRQQELSATAETHISRGKEG